MKPVISLAIAPTQTLAPAEAVESAVAAQVDTLAVAVAEAVRNATNVVRWDILHGTVQKVEEVQVTVVATRVVAGATAVEEDMVADLADVLGRRATLAAGTATCLAIALKAKNATTVSCSLS